MKRLLVSLTLACVTASTAASAVEIEDVGSITFPTSGSPEAQEHFLRGVGILYSFGWKQAIEQFQAAQELEPDFAMAYWGESLCYNHPLMAEQDRDNPTKVLLRLGTTPEERLAKARTMKEKGYVAAVDALFMGEGSPTERRIAYMEAMRRLHESFPEDQEVATFYSLSLLSAAGPMGDESLRTRVLAGSIALGRVQRESRSPRCCPLHHSRFRRPDPRTHRASRSVAVREDRARCLPRPSHANAHLHPARHVGGGLQVEPVRL